jgi:hypothetical protein
MNTENGDRVEESDHRKDLNPFADVDEDSDEGEGDVSFEIGDLEEDIEGRGLMGNHESEENGSVKKHVGIPDLASVLSFTIHSPGSPPPNTSTSVGIGRASFPSLWPFGSSGNTSPKPNGNSASTRDRTTHNHEYSNGKGTSADELDDIQSPDEDSENSSDEGYGGHYHAENGDEEMGEGVGSQYLGKRRLSVTTEAKRRTSLEDDDEDEEVVHVAMAEADADAHGKEIEGLRGSVDEGEGEGELVEIEVRHEGEEAK